MNKYGSITETFICDPLLTVNPLSAKVTPPADLNLVLGDFTLGSYLYGAVAGGAVRRGNFLLNDIPRIVGVGIWCNMADGLVQIDNPNGPDTGLLLQINADSFNSANVNVQSGITFNGISVQIKIPEFNQIFDTDYLLDMSALNYTLTGQPAPTGSGYFRLQSRMIPLTAKFSTISIDPAYAAKPLLMRPMVLVEHSFPLQIAGF